MAKDTGVEWANHTFNLAWGCEKVSPGCDKCYAQAFDHRLGGDHWGRDEHYALKPLKLNSESYWRQPLAWNDAARKSGVPQTVFCSSMTDVNYDHPEMGPLRERLWPLILGTPWLRWLLLTKRPQNWRRFLPWKNNIFPGGMWSNAWLGVTVENADYVWRIEELRRTPANIRFISYEPALGPVDFTPYLTGLNAIDWIIAGDESGHGARRAELDWYRAVRDQIAASNSSAKFFLKQQVIHEGRRQRKVSLPVLDGRQWTQVPGKWEG